MVKYEEPLWASMRKMHVTGVDSQDGTTREPSAIKKREGPGYVEALQWLRNEGELKGWAQSKCSMQTSVGITKWSMYRGSDLGQGAANTIASDIVRK